MKPNQNTIIRITM